MRDARINMIYEGTNTIQSLDLLGRKVLGDNGAKLKKFGKLIADFVEEEGTNEAMQEFVNPLADLGDKVTKLTTETRHEGLRATPTRWAPPRSTTCASAATWCSPTSGRAWPRWRCAKKDVGRPVLRGQAAHRALLLRQAAARDRDADPQRARRRRAADGDGRSAVLRPRRRSPTTPRRPDMTMTLRHAAARPRPRARCRPRRRPGRRRRACGRRSTTRPRRRSRWCASPRAAASSPARSRRCSTPIAKPDAVCDECTDERKDKPVRRHDHPPRHQAERRRQERLGRRRHPRPEQRQGLQARS